MDSNRPNLQTLFKFKQKLSMCKVEISIVIKQRLSKIYSSIEVPLFKFKKILKIRNYLFFLVSDALLLKLENNIERQPASGLQSWRWAAILIVSSKEVETRSLFENVSVRLTYCQDTLPTLTLAILKPQET
jgi:hypothetical protein